MLNRNSYIKCCLGTQIRKSKDFNRVFKVRHEKLVAFPAEFGYNI